jgi:predicted lysophospholipase L1 biosynthesis ABC-type transport system permease subunit
LTIVGVEPEGFEGTSRSRTRAFTVPLSMSDTLLERLRQLPGVVAASAASMVPLGGGAWGSRRINEIGVRMAPGASRRDILALVLREVALLLAPGCMAGAVAALALSRFATSFLFGVTPTDPAAFAIAAGALALSTLAAGYLPARSAARVDPMAALRCD